MGTLWWVGFWAISTWSVGFGAYIVAFFLVQDPRTWRSIEDFGSELRPILIGPHFWGGAILSIFGPLQMLGCVRSRCPAVHRWSGRILLVLALITIISGSAFTAVYSTIGATVMDVPFWFFALAFLVCVVMAWRSACRRDFVAHRSWGTRTFALIVASAVYRLLVLPLFVSPRDDPNQQTGQAGIIWLNTAAYFFVPLSLIPAEIYLRTTPVPEALVRKGTPAQETVRNDAAVSSGASGGGGGAETAEHAAADASGREP